MCRISLTSVVHVALIPEHDEHDGVTHHKGLDVQMDGFCAGNCVGPEPLGAACAIVHPHGAPAATSLILHCARWVKLSYASSQDGMDQAKWSVPRSRSSVLPKSLSGLSRPKLKVQGVWVHGIMLKLWVLDPRSPSDASSVLETLTRTIEGAMARCEELGVKPPTELLCWVALLHLSVLSQVVFRQF